MTLIKSRISTTIRKATLSATALSQKTSIDLDNLYAVNDNDKEIVKVPYIHYPV